MPQSHDKACSAIALDLGSTRIKLGYADAAGRLVRVDALDAPQAIGDGLIREIEPRALRDPVERLLDECADGRDDRVGGQRFGLVCQRSTFVVWDRDSGHELTPLISWQDRRAADWCERHHVPGDTLLRERAGLLLSPHYAGPKLAAMQAQDQTLAAALASGDALFGTLDAWLTWRWTGGRIHRTDLTMAARTGMVDIVTGEWSDELLELFGVPRTALPEIVASDAAPVALNNGLRLCAGLADQASGALAVLGAAPDAALVNLGTGGFVLRVIDGPNRRVPGYLTAPVLASGSHGQRYVLEGTINGAGPAVDQFGAGPTTLVFNDATPDGFALPDMYGIGAPHWRPEFGQVLSAGAQRLDTAGQRRIVIEGLLFRVYEILCATGAGQLPAQVYLSGGLTREPAIAHGLASLLGQPVQVLGESETTLVGAARLALGLEPRGEFAVTTVEPSAAGSYLRDKFPRWKAWVGELLNQ